MDLNMNPLVVPTQEHLEYFYQTVLLPKYNKDKLEQIDVGDGRSYKLPELTFQETTLKPESSFKRDDRKYRPRDMFFQQNDSMCLKPLSEEFKKRNVDERVAAVTQMPKLKFSLKPVKLIKPRYGERPQSVFK
jgi:hypothetical protein